MVSDDPDAVASDSGGAVDELAPHPAPRTGAHDLALAVLQQSIEDLERFRAARDPKGRRLYQHAFGWVMSSTRRHLFSFTSVCHALGLPTETLRAALRARYGPAESSRPAAARGETASEHAAASNRDRSRTG